MIIAPFKAETPRIGERYLPEGGAVLAQDCRTDRGEIQPLLQPSNVETVTNVLVYREATSAGYDTGANIVQKGEFEDHFYWSPGAGWTIPLNEAFHAAYQYDDSLATYTSYLTEINDGGSGTDDVILFPATEDTADAFLLGSLDKFSEITVNYASGTAGVGGTVTWQYYNGSSWAALSNVTDDTTGFTVAAADDLTVTFDIPSDWVASSINSSVPLYWIRAKVASVYSTNPQIDSASISDGQNRSAHHDGTAASDLFQDLEQTVATQRFREGAPYSVVFTLAAASGAVSITPKLGGTAGTARTTDGQYTETINAGSTDTRITFTATASAESCDIDLVSAKLTISSWAADAGGGNDAWVRLGYEASDVADTYNGMTLRIVSGTGAGTDEYTITDYWGNTANKFHQCDVTPTWANGTPDDTSVVEIYKTASDEEVLSIYMYDRDGDQEWLRFAYNTSVVRAPVGGDDEERTIWADGNEPPKMSYMGLIDVVQTFSGNSGCSASPSYPQDWYTLGVPAPVATPITTLVGTADDANESPETRNYVYTYVTAKDEESKPSPISEDLDWREGQTVSISNMDDGPVGRFNVTRKRIYRVNTGLTGADFQFVAEIDVASTTFTDDVPSIELAETIASSNYDMPPVDLHHIIEMPNGMLVGLSGNELCFSEPYFPHAWPTEYRQALHDEGVALAAYGATCLVGTKSEPVIAHGVHPDSVSMEKLEQPYPCVSAESMVDMGDFALYAGPDGLVMSKSQQVALITAGSITAKQWQALTPTSFKAFRWDHLYVCFYDNGTPAGFMFDPQTKEFYTLSAHSSAGFINPQTGYLYIFNGAIIKQWEGGSAYTSSWKSKEFYTRHKQHQAFGRIDAESFNSVTLKTYVDGTLRSTKTVTSDEPFTINTAPVGNRFQYQIDTTDVIKSLEVSSSLEGLNGAGE